jgi:S1-C subfamily serine protease
VAQERLLDRGMKTMRSIGQRGAGGTTAGEIGRVASVQLGSFVLKDVITMFSKDKAGMLADPSLAGNIGAQIVNRFRVTLDYRAKRIILEPAATFTYSFDAAFGGLALRAEGPGYRLFRVTELLEDSPATDAGIQVGDVITAIDGTAASALTLSGIREMFEKPVSYSLSLQRGNQSLTSILTPRRLIQSQRLQSANFLTPVQSVATGHDALDVHVHSVLSHQGPSKWDMVTGS